MSIFDKFCFIEECDWNETEILRRSNVFYHPGRIKLVEFLDNYIGISFILKAIAEYLYFVKQT